MKAIPSCTICVENLNNLDKVCSVVAPFLEKKDILALYGNLGLGKTTLTQYLLKYMGIKKNTVTSPTFNLVHIHTPVHFPPIWHFDLYRLQFPEEIYEIGFEEALCEGISIIEWPEKLNAYLPKNHLAIHLSFDKTEKNARTLTFIPKGNWNNKYNDLLHKLTPFKPKTTA